MGCSHDDKEKGDVRTDSQTVSRQVLSLLISKAAQKHWKVAKRLYGFKDSSRVWYFEFDRVMKELGCESVRYDNVMFVLICNILQDSGECQLRVFTDSRVDSKVSSPCLDTVGES